MGHGLVNCRNGLLDIQTGELTPHSPDRYGIIQLPVEWNPLAYHERGDRFLDEVLPNRETRDILEEFFGYSLLDDNRFQKVLLLLGEAGEGGKSVYLRWVKMTLGDENVSAVTLQDLSDRFRGADIAGKIANIFSDLPQSPLKESAIFKILADGLGDLQLERKFKHPFTLRNPRTKLMFSANKPPRSADLTAAFFRRWIIVPFPFTFKPGTRGFDPKLADKLCTDEGRSYLLRLGVEGLRRLLERGRFAETEATQDALRRFRARSDNVWAFVRARCIADPVGNITKRELYGKYVSWCDVPPKHSPVSEADFAKALKGCIPGLDDERPRMGDKRITTWVGVRLRTPDDPEPNELHSTANYRSAQTDSPPPSSTKESQAKSTPTSGQGPVRGGQGPVRGGGENPQPDHSDGKKEAGQGGQGGQGTFRSSTARDIFTSVEDGREEDGPNEEAQASTHAHAQWSSGALTTLTDDGKFSENAPDQHPDQCIDQTVQPPGAGDVEVVEGRL